MAAIFQLRRGTTGSKPTLASGEFYMDTDTESLHLGIDSAGDEIVLAKLNDSNAGNFIIAGNLTVVGTITAPIITAINNKFATIEGQSGSWDASSDITSLNAFTSSQNTKNSTLGTLTGSIDNRLNAIENVSNSFVTESETASFFVGATVSSNTITFTKGNGTTAGITVTGGGDISLLNSFTESANGRLNNLELATGSYVLTSSFNNYTASISTASLVNRLNAIESVSGTWVTESETGSFLTSLNGALSASAQITAFGFVSSSVTASSLVTASVSSNTITFTKGNGSTFDITVAGGGGSTDISALNTFTGSANGRLNNLELFTASANSRLNAIENISSSWVTEAETASFVKNVTVNLNTLTFTKGDNTTYPLTIDTGSLPTGLVSGSSQITYSGISGIPAGLVSGSSQLTASYDARYETNGRNIVSSSAQITSFGFISSSTETAIVIPSFSGNNGKPTSPVIGSLILSQSYANTPESGSWIYLGGTLGTFADGWCEIAISVLAIL